MGQRLGGEGYKMRNRNLTARLNSIQCRGVSCTGQPEEWPSGELNLENFSVAFFQVL